MIITLTDGVTAELTDAPGSHSSCSSYSTRFDLTDLGVRNTAPRAGGSARVAGSRGPLPGPDDVMLFAVDTGVLDDALLFAGEPPTDEGRDLTAWLAATPTAGTLRLLNPRDFRLPQAADRQYLSDGSVVGYFLANAPRTPSRPARARIAPGVDLLMDGERYVGWAVEQPELYLTSLYRPTSDAAVATVAAGSDHAPAMPDPQLGRLIARSFDLISSDGDAFDRLLDRDPGVLQGLLDIRAQLLRPGDGISDRREILRAHIERALDFYFGWSQPPQEEH